MPHEIRDEINTTVGREIKEDWFTKPNFLEKDEDDHCLSKNKALAELEALKNIEEAARESLRIGRGETAWNLEVHGTLLKLGLSQCDGVAREYIPNAQIAPSFVPRTQVGKNLSTSKMIDFAIVLALDKAKPADANTEHLLGLIHQVFQSEPVNTQFVNQTQYPALQLRPISVPIETKVSGSIEDGRIQLALWVVAWHRRMKFFVRIQTGRPSGNKLRINTIPMLLSVEHGWKILFACDHETHLDVIGDMSIGDTKSITGLYTIIAVLRELAKWSLTEFREWMIDYFTPIGLDFDEPLGA